MHECEPLLLVSKLSIPPWRPHWVRRPRLLPPVAQDTGLRLLLCAAPAGFGKTTALIAWAHAWHTAGALTAWCSLDRDDNDLARFAAYLVGAFAQAAQATRRPGDLERAGQTPDASVPASPLPLAQALAELQRQAGADVEQLLVGLLNLLGGTGRPAALVLDDYHIISSPIVHQALARLLEHLPANVQIALGTRADPPLPLARLRARGQLAELRAAELQFVPDEIAAFFHQHGQPALQPEALARLVDWTEGWAAGLQLMALALPPSEGAQPPALKQLHAQVAGSQRHIFTFLADEVFAQQPPEVQDFLRATCIVDELSPELCDVLRKDEGGRMKDAAATAASDQPVPFILHPSSHILDQLEQANLFVVRLDPTRPWYRYHHLFSEFLRHRLDRDQPGLRPALHRRAAGLYATMGELAQAVSHALASDDSAYAAELIAGLAGQALFQRGEVATILSWAHRFSEPQLAAHPRLCLIFGRAAYLAQRQTLAEQFFARAEQGLALGDHSDGEGLRTHVRLLTMRAAVATLNGELGSAAAWLTMAEQMLPQNELELVATHASATGVSRLLSGDLRGATMAITRMEAVARQAHHTYFAADAVALLALIDLVAGRLRSAERRCIALLETFGGELPALPAVGLVLARLGAVTYHRGELERAEHLLRQGAQVGRRSLGHADRQIWPWLVRVAVARNDLVGLHTLLADDDGQGEVAGDAVIAGLCMAARAEGLLALGAVDEAWHWAEQCARLPGEHVRDSELLVQAHVLLARHRPGEALVLLEPLLDAMEAGGRNGHVIEGLVAKAMALADLQRQPEATAVMGRARALGEPEGYVYVFAKMKHARGGAEPLIEALTEREHEVLQLIARGATNQDIAEALVVTVGTVKSHLNHILGKLGARNRTEAVAHARGLGLL